MRNANIIHVRLVEPYQGEADYFFGSIAAIYDVLPVAIVGITYSSLRNTLAKRSYCYSNTRCDIRARIIHRKHTRAAPPTNALI